MQETAKLPSGPQTLCFNKEDFMKEDFNVENFVVECRRKVSLDTLRNDLHIYLKILQNAMIELINKDYADFVNLSTNLVGMDKAINNLIHPLSSMKQEVLNVRNVIAETEKLVDDKIKYQLQIQERKEMVKMMMSMAESVEKMEKLLGIQSSTSCDGVPLSRELNGQLVERVATEFNKLQFYVSKSRGLPIVEDLKPRIANITQMLQYNLEGSFREGLTEGNTEVLLECLRTYATIDKMRDAENLFRTLVVKQYMEETINEQFIRNHPQGLVGMLEAVMDFFPMHYVKLREVTTGSTKGTRTDTVGGYDFVVNAIFPEVVSNMEARTPSIFAPGNPNVFHEKYTASMKFLERFELQCANQASVKRLRTHQSYNTFMSKWSLPVYFQIRFQEIAGTLETSLCAPFTECDDGRDFKLEVSRVLWECLGRCWDSDVYLSALCHRFWKLSLQLIARYSTWMGDIVLELNKQGAAVTLTKSDSSSGLQQLAAKPQNGTEISNSLPMASSAAVIQTTVPETPAAISVRNVAILVTDSQAIFNKLSGFFDSTVFPRMSHIGDDTIKQLKDSLVDSTSSLQTHTPRLNEHITTEVCSLCTSHLKAVNDIPRLYRRTNREMPTKPSSYVALIVKPISEFVQDLKGVISDSNRHKWVTDVLQAVTEQYLNITTDVLTSVRKMEESLKRLKAARGTNTGGGAHGASDDDKIRHQLLLDVKEFSRQIKNFNISLTDVEAYGRLLECVESAISTAAVSTTTVT